MQEKKPKLVRPKGIGADTIYYDLNQLDAVAARIDLVDHGRVRPTTIFIGHLPVEKQLAGKKYQTLIVDIDGSAVLCPQPTNLIIEELSALKTASLRFYQWLALALNLNQLPYFSGINSFIPSNSQIRHQPSWVGIHWYASMRTFEKSTLVTFLRPQQRQKVVIRLEMSAARLTEQLTTVHTLIVNTNHILTDFVKDETPYNTLITSVPPNIPESSSLQLPQIKPAQLIDFILKNHDYDICCIAENFLQEQEEFDISSAIEAAKYGSRPPRALTYGRKLLEQKQNSQRPSK
ncbi:hypothetical protein [Loigolactobacillus zhaoyuanensis]|uniref:hypothetical protein n=1 Tax=Loigolactobacillus zhaoyuanensis TaxID=2486017 RepID=UPI000F7456E1|nr:hypothetical protein [Loigolactobacillus zhaoyuanensis]